MAKPATRQQLIDYSLRKLGAPVLEINIDDDQIDDLIDDAIQLFQDRHFDGVERMYLKYELTQDDLDRGNATSESGATTTTGQVTTTGTTTAGSIADASELSGAATDPRMSISGIEWSVAATTQILWDATSNVVCFTCNGSGSYGFGDGAPSLANNAGSGITGDVLATHGTSVGTIIVRFRKVSGFDNIT